MDNYIIISKSFESYYIFVEFADIYSSNDIFTLISIDITTALNSDKVNSQKSEISRNSKPFHSF